MKDVPDAKLLAAAKFLLAHPSFDQREVAAYLLFLDFSNETDKFSSWISKNAGEIGAMSIGLRRLPNRPGSSWCLWAPRKLIASGWFAPRITVGTGTKPSRTCCRFPADRKHRRDQFFIQSRDAAAKVA